MNEEEADLLMRIGTLIRGDWSGNYFDGRDVRDWIKRVVDGERLEDLSIDLKGYEENYR